MHRDSHVKTYGSDNVCMQALDDKCRAMQAFSVIGLIANTILVLITVARALPWGFSDQCHVYPRFATLISPRRVLPWGLTNLCLTIHGLILPTNLMYTSS